MIDDRIDPAVVYVFFHSVVPQVSFSSISLTSDSGTELEKLSNGQKYYLLKLLKHHVVPSSDYNFPFEYKGGGVIDKLVW